MCMYLTSLSKKFKTTRKNREVYNIVENFNMPGSLNNW